MKVLVSDNLSPKGIEILKQAGLKVVFKTGLKPEELKKEIKDCDGLVIRSATKVTADIIGAARKLKVIGRAGIGLDNVDIPTASKKGVIVMNTPGGNVVTTAEHTITMLLALSRNIPQATTSMKAGKWEKKKFTGREVFNKTLGIIGIGRIGSIVADRARGLKMHVIAYDPYIRPETAEKLGVGLVSLDDLYTRSDYISIHVPLTKDTKELINRESFAKMKDGVMLINCSRGGIVDEGALHEAMQSGKVAGAALDVFAQEPPPESYPLFTMDKFICTPHLGAATEEAQENVAVAIANQLVDFLKNGNISNAVNFPSVSSDVLASIQPYLTLVEKMGSFQMQIAKGGIQEVTIEYVGDVANMDTRPITIAMLKGLFAPILKHDVNFVNAPIIAKERGVKVTELKSTTTEDFTNLITLRVKTPQEENALSGTIFGKKELRLVRINTFRLEAVLEGHMLFIYNTDEPGVIGAIGTTMGKAGLNIARMHVGQETGPGRNVILLNTNAPVSAKVLKEMLKIPQVVSAQPLEF